MNTFCKVFYTQCFGQIVVMRQNDDTGAPAVYCYAKPTGLGVSDVALSFTDTEAGYEQANAVFTQMNEAAAIEAVAPLFRLFGEVAA